MWDETGGGHVGLISWCSRIDRDRTEEGSVSRIGRGSNYLPCAQCFPCDAGNRKAQAEAERLSFYLWHAGSHAENMPLP